MGSRVSEQSGTRLYEWTSVWTDNCMSSSLGKYADNVTAPNCAAKQLEPKKWDRTFEVPGY